MNSNGNHKSINYSRQREEKQTSVLQKKIIKMQGKKKKCKGRNEKKKWTEKNYKNNRKTSNKMRVSTYLSITILNINGLNAPIKRHSVADYIK